MEFQLLPEISQGEPALRVMFEARKRVFVDLLKWDVPVLAGRYEVDQFDTGDAEYLVLVDEHGSHRASARLLRTEGPHILADLYPVLCERELPRGPATREITRFCLDPGLGAIERRRARNQLVTALVEHALRAGISDYTGVATISWFRQIEDFGWDCRALGKPLRFGGGELVGLHIRIDAETPQLLARAGINSLVTCRLSREGMLQ
jgi:acyl homoserine lactone synthase/acyl-homoserine lactone synthase